MTTQGTNKLPVTSMGRQSQSCCLSRQVQEPHLGVSNHSKQRGMMQSIPSSPAKSTLTSATTTQKGVPILTEKLHATNTHARTRTNTHAPPPRERESTWSWKIWKRWNNKIILFRDGGGSRLKHSSLPNQQKIFIKKLDFNQEKCGRINKVPLKET